MNAINTRVGRLALKSVGTPDFIGLSECHCYGVNANAPHYALNFIESEFPPAFAGC
jgi:hypothetical protein